MKSELFRNNPTPTKRLSEDLLAIARLPDLDQISDVLPGIVTRYVRAPNSPAESKVLDEMRAAFPLATDEFNSLLQVSAFFLREIGESDSADDICDDLKTTALIGGKELGRLRRFVDALVREHKENFGMVQRVYATQHAVLRVPSAVSTVVDLRAVVPKGFKIGDDVKTYEPEVSKLVPIAIMRIRFDDDKDIVFQMDYRTLRILAAEFQAAEKQMNESVSFVGENKVDPGRIGDQ